MKIKQVESILKKSKTIIVSKTPDCQWLGNGRALYPIYDLPELNESQIFALFDIPAEKREKFHYKEEHIPSVINISDFDETEQLVEAIEPFIICKGVQIPLKTEQGVVFIDKSLLSPFADLPSGYECFTRTAPGGTIYIAVKSGINLIGIIYPSTIIDEKFCSNLSELLFNTRLAFFNNNGFFPPQNDLDKELFGAVEYQLENFFDCSDDTEYSEEGDEK